MEFQAKRDKKGTENETTASDTAGDPCKLVGAAIELCCSPESTQE